MVLWFGSRTPYKPRSPEIILIISVAFWWFTSWIRFSLHFQERKKYKIKWISQMKKRKKTSQMKKMWCYDLGLVHHINQGAQRFSHYFWCLMVHIMYSILYAFLEEKKSTKTRKPKNDYENWKKFPKWKNGWSYDLGLRHHKPGSSESIIIISLAVWWPTSCIRFCMHFQERKNIKKKSQMKKRLHSGQY